jgi:3-hydroxyisobutyrate dehydrogenase-like beta-hydroxyacid dehydrogenase
MDEKIGLIGIGLVGTALAENLIAAGFQLVGYDIDGEKCRKLAQLGGTPAGSPHQAAAGCERVVLSLMNSEIVRQVLEGPDGVLRADPPPGFVIDTTTGEPEMSEEFARKLADQGIFFLDATISGSSEQIQARRGVFMVGGDKRGFRACGDVFAALAEKVFHVGPPGSGCKAKLAVNLIMGLNRLALAEGLVFAERLGLEPASFLALARESFAYSRIMDVKGEKMLRGDFTVQGRLAQHRKDVDIILRYGRKLHQGLPLSSVHLEVLDAAIAAGEGELDNAAVIREIRRRSR